MDQNNSSSVSVVDIKMPFMSMVVFMVKAAIASIPAIIILSIISMAVTALMGGVFESLEGLRRL